MAYKNLQSFLEKLNEENEIVYIDAFVDPVLEIAEITDRFSKLPGGGKALCFKNTGTGFPVVTNIMGSEKRMALAFGVDEIKDIENRLIDTFEDLKEPRQGFFEKLALLPQLGKIAAYFPTVQKTKAACQEVVINEPDLSIFPVLKTWPFDGGRFFTLPLVFTEDPETADRNVGMYRMQILDKSTTGMHWHRHKTGANHYEKYKKLGMRMPVAVAFGGDPAITFSATAPLPENIDELLLAGFLREKSVSLVKCKTQNLFVPADSEIILEGYVDPAEDKVVEGPFGDHTGFYSLEDFYPTFHITCITHRKKAVLPATLVGIPPQEDAWMAKVTERIFLMPIRLAIAPELIDMNIPEFGVAHNLTIVSIDKTYPGQAKKIMNALWGAGQMMFNKVLIVVDKDVNVQKLEDVFSLLKSTDLKNDVIFSQGPLDVLDHSARYAGYGAKMGIDLTKKLKEEEIGLEKKDKENKEDYFSEDSEMLEIKDIQIIDKGPDNELGIALIQIEKGTEYQFKELSSGLVKKKDLKNCSVIFVVDITIDITLFKEFLWYFLNNLEPGRDILRIKRNANDLVLILDGSSKSKVHDDVGRDWPNPVYMTEDIVGKVDDEWGNYKIGPVLKSPSDHYRKLILTHGARAYYNDTTD